MAAQVDLLHVPSCFSVLLAIRCLKIGTFVLIKVLLTYVSASSVNIFKKRLEQVWTGIFPRLLLQYLFWPNTPFPNSLPQLPPPLPWQNRSKRPTQSRLNDWTSRIRGILLASPFLNNGYVEALLPLLIIHLTYRRRALMHCAALSLPGAPHYPKNTQCQTTYMGKLKLGCQPKWTNSRLKRIIVRLGRCSGFTAIHLDCPCR